MDRMALSSSFIRKRTLMFVSERLTLLNRHGELPDVLARANDRRIFVVVLLQSETFVTFRIEPSDGAAAILGGLNGKAHEHYSAGLERRLFGPHFLRILGTKDHVI